MASITDATSKSATKRARGKAAKKTTKKAGNGSPPSGIATQELLRTLKAFRRGDFSARLKDGQLGADSRLAEEVNELIEQTAFLAAEMRTAALNVGVKGKSGHRVARGTLRGEWLAFVDGANDIVESVTTHAGELAQVVDAVSHGDLTRRIDLDRVDPPLSGDFLRHAKSVNAMADHLSLMGAEVTRVAKQVGVDGKLGAQAQVKGLGGLWKEMTDSVNDMARNLTDQVRDIASVTTAVAQGDLSKKITVEVKGELLELKATVNTMVDQLSSFAAEVTRVAREVGTDGVLGGQANVRGVSGTWRELTDNVNSMAQNLTDQVRNIAAVTTAVAQGDLSKKITVDAKGEILELKDTINTMVDQLGAFGDEVTRMAREVGTEGILGGQAVVPGAGGVWKELTDNVNSMAQNLTDQVRNIAAVTTAVAQGDLSKKITVDAEGEILALKETINEMVDRLSSFSSEVTRVARLVGTEGTLGVQAEVAGVSGVWKELTDNVNQMGNNLTYQVRDIAEVTTAVANGDLSRKITVEVKGEILQLKNTVNAMVDQLSSFAEEVTRVAREVGTEGVLGGQAAVEGVSGIWKELTDNVNLMANNLTDQVRNIAEVSSAVAAGDLSKTITVDARGEVLDLKITVNTMVGQLNAFGAEVTRLARNVGVEGKLGGQAEVEGVRGIWKELTDNVNLMASNLTGQVRDIALVTTAVANGDLSRQITVDAKGEVLQLKNTINTMVDQLSSFADEVTRLAREVGVEGKLGGQADVRGVSGRWRELTDNVNMMARNLTDQVRNISQVSTAIAKGDLEKKIIVEARGEVLELKNTINTMVDQLSSFAEEVTRVAREVGTEGKLGGQADVKGVAGTWKNLTDNVNQMATNLTNQVRDIAAVTTAVAQGDLTKKITVEVRGEMLELKNTVNTMVDQLSSFAEEVTRVARDVGLEGKLGGQADVKGVAGTWRDLTDNVNLMASNLTNQVRDIAAVTTAVAQGDLTKKITVEVRGEILELKNTVNTMVDQLSSFAEEVARVAREVGTEGILGGQAQVRGVSGIWRELTDNVNDMARNLTEQVRGIAKVVTAVALGDLKQQLHFEARGEIATLVQTINDMIITLSTFAEEVTRVARDVGVEGELGGQADVPGAAGVWRDLTNNVNELAGNLTNQVRSIGEVATAVTKGDLTRSITVEARGEVALLKDNINQMIVTLAETTRTNEEQDWLKTNLTKFTRLLQGQRDLLTVARMVLSELAPVVDAQHGAFYTASSKNGQPSLRLYAAYAYKERKNVSNEYGLGEGLVGQCAFEKKRILLTNVPHDYIQISSGLGEARPLSIVVMPILFEEETKGVIELASFVRFTAIQLNFLEQLLESLGIVVATIEAQMRTDELLRQSQSLAEELQTQQAELQQTNEELEEKAQQLSHQKAEVEEKNREVVLAKQALEEKAEQLALTSKYKSEFLANMSHELRTPLNSLLILARQLADNHGENLSEQQVEYARTIQSSGNDLLALINEILDLAKIESGTMEVEIEEVSLDDLQAEMRRTFDQMAAVKSIDFGVERSSDVPASLQTDGKRLAQVIRNLLSNAFKFTEKGTVMLWVEPAQSGWSMDHDTLDRAETVLAFSVIDTGIGIPADRQKLVFEAFQQADGGSARKYGGTGLGLSISREIARLLGGEIRLQSAPGKGSTFTLYVPSRFIPRTRRELAAAPPRGTTSPPQLPRPEPLAPPTVADDRMSLNPGERSLLIIDSEEDFARGLLDLARAKGFKGLVALEGHVGFELARRYRPDAIILDLELPDVDGWVLLDRLKHDAATRHIPVHLTSPHETDPRRGRREGAIAYLQKPASREALDSALSEIIGFVEAARRLLLVEDDAAQRQSLVALLGAHDVEIVAVEDGETALEALDGESFDCMVVDLGLKGMSGVELIEAIKQRPALSSLPIIVYTGRELTRSQEMQLRRLAESIIIKDAHSPERLLDETALFLHRVRAKLPPDKQQMLRQTAATDPALEGKKILIIDDDVRNIFALASVLEQQRMVVRSADNGREGLALLDREPDVDLVLMDIMMPEMDGYEATRAIRRSEQHAKLPIIALTAKAMKGDRDKCLEAGASDYITKPLDRDQLLSLLRVWLYRR